MDHGLACGGVRDGGGTGAAQSAPPLTRIAFGSCAHQERPQLIWEAVLQYRPELFLFLGDNVYGDVRDGKVVDQADYQSLLIPDEADRVHRELVTAADKLCAYLKCLEERGAGNPEFAKAEKALRFALLARGHGSQQRHMPGKRR